MELEWKNGKRAPSPHLTWMTSSSRYSWRSLHGARHPDSGCCLELSGATSGDLPEASALWCGTEVCHRQSSDCQRYVCLVPAVVLVSVCPEALGVAQKCNSITIGKRTALAPVW
ncbi:sorbitol dehydrogenase [Anopheles sinensis]|uniref:Sorbitol dehydrogenase n=1 Tax=Anopheles sinensis TaxID=74873 RepID=A0A084WHD6_ANOSI|nr:sorbitol dehydrogenase [Anopheles sinensis]